MTSDNRTLAGKGAVITGAGRGIGRSIALGFARAGASVCCAARTETDLDATVWPCLWQHSLTWAPRHRAIV